MATSNTAPKAGEQRVEAVERALRLLDCFGEERDALSLKELADLTGLYKSTILRLAASLERFGYLSRSDDGLFRLGPTLWRLGALYRRRFDFAPHVRPILERLADATGESASFYVRDGDMRVCLLRHNSRQAVRHHLDEGTHLPLDQGAPGHLIRAYTDRGDPDTTEILARGHTVSLGERDPDIAAIAVPVHGRNGRFAGALVVSGVRSRFDEPARAEAIKLAKQAAAELEPAIVV